MQYWIGDDGNNTKSAPWYQQGRQWIMYGEGGNDDLKSGMSHDSLYGGTGNDTLRALWGNDWLEGESGNDHLEGDDGNDTLVGGEGDDYLHGGNKGDTLVGGVGNDYLDGDDTNDGPDRLYGGFGNDTLMGYGDTLAGVEVDSSTGGYNEIDVLSGAYSRFILGDAYHAYYSFSGSDDYALIQSSHGNQMTNSLTLHGSFSNYSMGTISSNETGLYYANDLIAVFQDYSQQDVTTLLGGAQFV